MAIHQNKIVWVNGPFPAGENNKQIFNKPNGLKSKLKGNQAGIGDQGYVGDPDKLQLPTLALDNPDVKD